VSADPRVTAARTRFPLLANALERHLGWARDFVIAGDVDCALDAIRDASAACAELRAADTGASDAELLDACEALRIRAKRLP
jgi:hypothetical protein